MGVFRKGKLLSDDPEEEAKQRTFTSLINKLTIDNFDRIVGRIGEIEVQDAKTLKGFVAKIFNKALTESIFCEMYASLCKQLLRIMPRCATHTTEPRQHFPACPLLSGAMRCACMHACIKNWNVPEPAAVLE